ncbi:MAG: hypothetical protein ACI90V_012092, partial [Bacillariaceae sp.]
HVHSPAARKAHSTVCIRTTTHPFSQKKDAKNPQFLNTNI